MRGSGTVSTGPNLAKSTCGHSESTKPVLPAGMAAGAVGAPFNAVLTKSCTSSRLRRPFGPLPLTRARSTPSSRANLRTEGLACGLNVGDSGTGSKGTGAACKIVAAWSADASDGAARSAEAARTGRSAARSGAGVRSGTAAAPDSFSAAIAPEASLASRSRITLPWDTLSPILVLNSFTTPAAGEGISMVALSDSTAINDCSGLTESPGATSTSITSTVSKSPMSGTRISLMAPMAVQV